MDRQALVEQLVVAKQAICQWSFSKVGSLKTESYQQDYGDPVINPTQYYQIEVEFQQEWMEHDLAVIQVSLIARSLRSIIETQICFHQTGQVEEGFPIYDMTSGVPEEV